MAAAPAKRGPNVLVTGTPGCGKSSLCEAVLQRVPGARHVVVGEVAREKGLHAGAGPHGALQIDEAAEDKLVDELEAVVAGGSVLVEHHSVDFFPERWFDLVLVLRTDNTVLFDRLTKRCVGRAAAAAAAEASCLSGSSLYHDLFSYLSLLSPPCAAATRAPR